MAAQARAGATRVKGLEVSTSSEDRDLGRQEIPGGSVPEEERRIRTERADGPGLISRLPGMVYQARLSPEWPMEYVSPGAFDLTGLRPETFLLGGPRAFGEIIHADDRERVWRGVLEAIDDGGVFSLEYRIRHTSGDFRHVWDHGHAVRDGSGEVLGVEGLILDVTNRVDLTERLRDAQRRETIGRLSGVVAHDFNNFLTGIIGSLELAASELDTRSGVAGHVALALESAERARGLTRQLLVVSRGRPQKRRLVEMNERIAEFRGFLSQIVGSPVALVVELSDESLPLVVDPALVDQLLLNLVVNAREAIAGYGRITLRTSREGEWIRLVVADDGCGIEPGTLERVFDPFFTTKDSGTGLGLATVKEIVDEVGGRIGIDSRVGEGTTFVIELPRSAARAPAAAAEDHPPAARRSSAGETILVVDDDATVLRVIRSALTRFGYEVLEAGSPASCRTLVEGLDAPPDLALVDVTLPETSGITLAHTLQEEGLIGPVLFMSGYAREEMVEGAEELRDSVYLEKPFSVEDLVRTVSRALDDQRAAGSGAA